MSMDRTESMRNTVLKYWPFALLVVGAVAWGVGFLLNPTGTQSAMFYKGGKSWFSDFYMIQDFLAEADYYRPQSYSWHDSNYVALIRLLFSAFPYSFIGALAFTVLSFVLYLLAVAQFARNRNLPTSWTLIAAVCTSNFISSVERGNSIVVSAAAVVLFLAWFDCDVKWKRTVAAVALAFAGVSKVSPALLGFLYLPKRQWREIAVCAASAIALFFVPFFIPGCGGWDGIRQWFLNSKANSQYYALYGAYGFPKLFYGIYKVMVALGYNGEARGVAAVRPLSPIFGVSLFAASFFAAKRHVRVFLTLAALLIAPGNQHGYCGLYLVPVMFWIMWEERSLWLSACVVAMFFAFVFPVPVLAAVEGVLQNVLLMVLAAFFAGRSLAAVIDHRRGASHG